MLLLAACSQRYFYRPRAANEPLLRAHFHDIGPGIQPGPHGDAVVPGDLLPDDGAACAGRAAQVPKLEGAAGQGQMSDGIILLDNDRVLGGILKTDRVVLTCLQIDLLDGRLLMVYPGAGSSSWILYQPVLTRTRWIWPCSSV